MPLDVMRLRDSSIAVLPSAEAFRAVVMLWCAAWHQKPAASLPDDDRVLARFAGFGRDLSGWTEVRAEALHGFIRCSDGRLYHPVIAAKANETWETNVNIETVIEGKGSRQRRWRERVREISAILRARGITPPAGASLKLLEGMLQDAPVDAPISSTRDVREMPFNIKERNINIRQDGSAVPRPDVISEGEAEPPQPAKAGTTRRRATRIDPAWKPSDADRAFAVLAGIPGADIDRQAAEFVDYWAGVGGEKGTKLDWPATWRNRCRQIAERKGYRPPPTAVPGTAAAGPPGWPSEFPDPERLFEIWMGGGWSVTAWGFPPGDPSCRIPRSTVDDRQKRRAEAA